MCVYSEQVLARVLVQLPVVLWYVLLCLMACCFGCCTSHTYLFWPCVGHALMQLPEHRRVDVFAANSTV